MRTHSFSHLKTVDTYAISTATIRHNIQRAREMWTLLPTYVNRHMGTHIHTRMCSCTSGVSRLSCEKSSKKKQKEGEEEEGEEEGCGPRFFFSHSSRSLFCPFNLLVRCQGGLLFLMHALPLSEKLSERQKLSNSNLKPWLGSTVKGLHILALQKSVRTYRHEDRQRGVHTRAEMQMHDGYPRDSKASTSRSTWASVIYQGM